MNGTISIRSQWQNDAYTPGVDGCGRAPTARLLSGRRTLLQIGCWVACLVTLLPIVAWAEWTVKRLHSQTGTLERCVLESNTVPVNDGYQETQVSMIVSTDTIIVKAKAPLDGSFGDIGLQVEKNDFIKMDKIVEERSALFAVSYTKILEQLKKASVSVKTGQKSASPAVKVPLRFWPTWPATGTHAVEFRLEGFSKAYTDMVACK